MEMSVFIQSKTGSYEADEGFNDDLAMCGVLHAWMVSQPFFYELTDQNLRVTMHERHIQEMEDQTCLPMFIMDGNESYEDTNTRSYWSN